MRGRVILSLVIILSASQLVAGWIKTYGRQGDRKYKDGGYRVVQTSDGGYTVVGETGDYGSAIWFLRFDSLGDTLWTRTYEFFEGYCIKEIQDGGYIIAGEAGFEQLLLMRTDSDGDTLWTRSYGDEKHDKGYWVCTTSDGGYAATGYVDAWPDFPRRLWLLRADSNGDTLWTKKYGGEGTLEDFGSCVEQTPDGGFILTGYTHSFSQYEDADVWLLKTDSLGDTLWTRTFGGDYGDGGKQVILTDDGGYAIAGIYDLTGVMFPESGDVLLIKTDSSGNLEWQKTYGITGGGFIETAYSLEQTSDGGYVVVGAKEGLGPTGRDLWLLKTDSLGDTIWTRTIGGFGSDDGRGVLQATGGSYVITGSTSSFSQVEFDYELWLIKTDSLGYVSIEESPVTHPPDFEIVNAVIPAGGSVVLRYSNYPQGFRASVYDATGRKVDSIESRASSGSISWGTGQNAGVYIIREEGGAKAKVVLVK